MSTLGKCGCNGNKELDFRISPIPVGESPKVSTKSLLSLQRFLSKIISESENTLRTLIGLKLIIINFILAKQKYRTAFLGLKSCLINCIFYRAGAKKHSQQEHFKKLLELVISGIWSLEYQKNFITQGDTQVKLG